ncbi:OmpA family protein [Buchnera aphidicola]|uniref:OmpA family protein n=1 Tax=Buchnera aphidicola TaxID=9 RepID=UPI0030EB1397
MNKKILTISLFLSSMMLSSPVKANTIQKNYPHWYFGTQFKLVQSDIAVENNFLARQDYIPDYQAKSLMGVILGYKINPYFNFECAFNMPLNNSIFFQHNNNSFNFSNDQKNNFVYNYNNQIEYKKFNSNHNYYNDNNLNHYKNLKFQKIEYKENIKIKKKLYKNNNLKINFRSYSRPYKLSLESKKKINNKVDNQKKENNINNFDNDISSNDDENNDIKKKKIFMSKILENDLNMRFKDKKNKKEKHTEKNDDNNTHQNKKPEIVGSIESVLNDNDVDILNSKSMKTETIPKKKNNVEKKKDNNDKKYEYIDKEYINNKENDSSSKNTKNSKINKNSNSVNDYDDTSPLQNFQISTRFNYFLTNNFIVYTRTGVESNLRENYFSNLLKYKGSFLNNNIKPVLSVGIEYKADDVMSTRLEYERVSKISNFNNLLNCDNDSLNFNILWNFDDFSWKSLKKSLSFYHNSSNTVINKDINRINLFEDISFNSNSSKITPFGETVLNKLIYNLKNMKLKNVSMLILGNSDRLEIKNKNNKFLALSRAESVLKYFKKHDIFIENTKIRSLDNHDSISNRICTNKNNKTFLKNCLSPDRRVEILIEAYQ